MTPTPTPTQQPAALPDALRLADEYAEARHVCGCHTSNAKTAAARNALIAALSAAAPAMTPGFRIRTLKTPGKQWRSVSEHEYRAALTMPEVFECEIAFPPQPPAAVPEALRKALAEAAQSLESVEKLAGRGGHMATMMEIREYAGSRASVAHAAISAYDAAPQAEQPGAAVPGGWSFGQPITEEMHVAACKVLTRAAGLDGTPQRMLDAMLAAAPAAPMSAQPSDPDDSVLLCISDLEHSAIYDNHREMQACMRAVSKRLKALAATPGPAPTTEQAGAEKCPSCRNGDLYACTCPFPTSRNCATLAAAGGEAPAPAPAAAPDDKRCQACIDRRDGFYGSYAPDCPVHDDDGNPRAAQGQEGAA